MQSLNNLPRWLKRQGLELGFEPKQSCSGVHVPNSHIILLVLVELI